MNEDDFSRLPPAAQAYIRELESRNRHLGERIAQLVPAPVQQSRFVEVEMLAETARGTGGFGSTGR